MWLMTKYGFYSVVQHKADPDMVLVRARAYTDLDNLLGLAIECEIDAADLPPIIETLDADYAYRLFMDREVWETLALALASEIDYPNFKAAVPGDTRRLQAYHRIWAEMAQYQAHVLAAELRRNAQPWLPL